MVSIIPHTTLKPKEFLKMAFPIACIHPFNRDPYHGKDVIPYKPYTTRGPLFIAQVSSRVPCVNVGDGGGGKNVFP